MRALIGAFCLMIAIAASPATAAPKNSWSINCGVDKGAILKTGKDWVFSTSRHMCDGGSFKQRAEISTNHFSPDLVGDYMFSTKLQMSTASREQFSVFSVHDGHTKFVGHSCAPPFQLYVMPNGQLLGRSGYLGKDGKSCTGLTLGKSAKRFTKSGTTQELKVLLRFEGNKEFQVFVWLDGELQIQGRNRQPNVDAMKSRRFFLKHGVYSRNTFMYEMRSTGLSIKRVRTKP